MRKSSYSSDVLNTAPSACSLRTTWIITGAAEVFIKTPEMPQVYNTPVKWGCPYDCGLCTDHEQHSCLTLVELTDSCNLRCPVCYASSGPERTTHRPLALIAKMLD